MTPAEARIAELERKLAHQRARSRMLKAELRSARQAIVRADQRDAQMERIWNTYLGRYGFRKIFTMYANMRAIAGMVGLSDAQIEACAGHLSMADVMDLAARLHPEQPARPL